LRGLADGTLRGLADGTLCGLADATLRGLAGGVFRDTTSCELVFSKILTPSLTCCRV
jgi:hypothetical protein